MDGKMNLSAALQNRMEHLIARQGVVSENIANASTPGYIARDLEFTGALKSAGMGMDQTNSMHLSGKMSAAKGKITEDRTHIRHDGNSVKMDEEMLKLQDVQMNYRLATQLYNKHAQMQKIALGRGQ